jgi:hypothetical protein
VQPSVSPDLSWLVAAGQLLAYDKNRTVDMCNREMHEKNSQIDNLDCVSEIDEQKDMSVGIPEHRGDRP